MENKLIFLGKKSNLKLTKEKRFEIVVDNGYIKHVGYVETKDILEKENSFYVMLDSIKVSKYIKRALTDKTKANAKHISRRKDKNGNTTRNLVGARFNI